MADNKKDLHKGFTCQCGKRHTFPLYVYAHWTEELITKCERCGVRYSLFMGEATLIEEGGET